MNTAILTDTSCGISREEAKLLGYEMIALPFLLDEVEYDEDKLTKVEFYEKLKQSNDIHTSQAPIKMVVETFDRLLKEYDNILYFPITSGLSSSYQSILPIVEEEYKNRVFVVDHKTISVVERGLLEDVSRFLKEGMSPQDIKAKVEENAKNTRVYIAVDTLEYLRKGGRVSALSAAVGNILNIKPILFSNGNKFEVVKKARGLKQAEDEMVNFVANDFKEFFGNEPIEKFRLGVAYTECIDEAKKFKDVMTETFKTDIILDELSTVIGCHIGTGAVAAAIYKKIDEN